MHENDNNPIPRKEGPIEIGRQNPSEWKPYKILVSDIKVYE
jgi:hypothetical protein